MKKKYIAVSLILALLVTQPVLASSVSDVKKQQNATKNKLESVQSNISGLEDKKSEAEEQVDELDNQLVSLLTTLDILEVELGEKEDQIKQAEADYVVAKAQEDEQYTAMKQRIKFMYEKGDTMYLQLFMESESIADMVNKADYAEKLYEYDRKLLIKFQDIKNQVAALEEQLVTEKSELLAMQGEYEAEKVVLSDLIEEKQKVVADFAAKLSNAKTQAKKYQQQIQEQNNQIRKIEEAAKKKAAEKAAAEKAAGNAGSGSRNPGGSVEIPRSEGTATGRAVADFGCQFIGNPYVAGGTSLTNGTDCSGFTMSVYSHFGYSIPRTSGSQLGYGTGVSYSEAQPGDIMCYAGHVGIYIGNGNIVHASTPATGIKITPATYRQILSVRRIIN